MGRVRFRFWIGCMIFLTMYVSFSVRVHMSVIIISMVKTRGKPDCMKEEGNVTAQTEAQVYGPQYNWNEYVQGLILGSYFVGYIVTALPGEYIVNWIGPFHTIFWSQFITAALNCYCVFGSWVHYSLLIVLRIAIGACAGIVYPALLSLINLWAPPPEKRRFTGGLFGNVVGTCITWPTVGLITEKYGYEWGFHLVSIQIGVFCIIFLIVMTARDSPSTNRWIKSEEIYDIVVSQAMTPVPAKKMPPYKKIFASFPFWAMAISHFGNVWGLTLQVLEVPKLLAEVIGFNLAYTGMLAALPQLTRAVFGIVFILINEHLRVRFNDLVLRKMFVLFSHIIPGVLLICIKFVGCRWILVVVLLTLSLTMNGAVAVTTLRNTHDLAPNFDHALVVLINCIGVITGIITPLINAALIEKENSMDQWGWNFVIGGYVYIFGGLFFIIFGTVKEQIWNEYTTHL